MDTRIVDFSDLGTDIIMGQLAKRMTNHNLEDAICLSLTSSIFYQSFERALADKLLQLLIDVTFLKKEVSLVELTKYFELINKLVHGRPTLMFITSSAKRKKNQAQIDIKMSPLSYIFSTLDVHLQKMFLQVAITSGNIIQFVSQIQETKCHSHIKELLAAKVLLLQESEKLATQTDLENHLFFLDGLICTTLGKAQLALERSLLDAAFNPNDTSPPTSYQLHDHESSCRIDILKSESSEKLGEGFALFLTDDAKLKPIRHLISPDDINKQIGLWHGLFQQRVHQRDEVVQSAVCGTQGLDILKAN